MGGKRGCQPGPGSSGGDRGKVQLCALREPHTLMDRLGAACKARREREALRTSTQHCPQCHQLSALGLLRAPSPSRGGGLTTPTPTKVLPPYRQMRLQGICRRSNSLNESRLGSSLPLLLPPSLPFLPFPEDLLPGLGLVAVTGRRDLWAWDGALPALPFRAAGPSQLPPAGTHLSDFMASAC